MNKKWKELGTGIGFLAPNILGFAIFTLFPLIVSMMLAFTNWDLRLHNMFRHESIRFVAFEHFVRLWQENDFKRYLANTMFLMLGMPISIAGSLCAALLLTQKLDGGNDANRRRLQLISIGLGCVFAVSVIGLALIGHPTSAMTVLIGGVVCGVMVGGAFGGQTVYRTFFFAPHFVAGVATYILWNKLYNPQSGPVNNALRPFVNGISNTVNKVSPGVVQAGGWVLAILACLLILWGMRKILSMWNDGYVGVHSLVLFFLWVAFPLYKAVSWAAAPKVGWCIAIVGGAIAIVHLVLCCRGREFTCNAKKGLGQGMMLGVLISVGTLILLGFGNVVHWLPEMAQAQGGLKPPQWVASADWAKPAIMIMMLWASIGSNNMLLYIAGLNNIPPALYEAADIDGASGFQRFWHITWPQLAPVTFFIVIMGVIQGLQGGFEIARTMTGGGPDGSTTTLSYYVYEEGFIGGHLGFASAISWVLFAMVFVVTIFNWKFGNKYVNE